MHYFILATRDPGSRATSQFLFVASLALLALASGCSSSFYYKVVQPYTQRDHPASEFGSKALLRSNIEAQGPVSQTQQKLCVCKRLERGRRTYLILQMDGGGIMGITPARLVSKLEQAVLSREEFQGQDLRDAVSVCSGTSTGAIIAGAISAGVSAKDISYFYENDGYTLFRKSGRLPLFPVFHYKFDRSVFQQSMIDVLADKSPEDPHVRLRDLSDGPLLMLAAYDLVGRQTLFLRSRTQGGGCVPDGSNVKLIDAISASALSAPVMFGKIVAPNYEWKHLDAENNVQLMRGAVFADGGQGTQNTTLAAAALEGLRILADDPESQVVLVSFGSGDDLEERGFENVIGYWGFQQLADFVLKNQARSEAVTLQKNAVRKLESSLGGGLKVFRFNWNHTNDDDAAAFSINAKQRDWLRNKAEEIASRPDFRLLVDDLADPQVQLQPYRNW